MRWRLFFASTSFQRGFLLSPMWSPRNGTPTLSRRNWDTWASVKSSWNPDENVACGLTVHLRFGLKKRNVEVEGYCCYSSLLTPSSYTQPCEHLKNWLWTNLKDDQKFVNSKRIQFLRSLKWLSQYPQSTRMLLALVNIFSGPAPLLLAAHNIRINVLHQGQYSQILWPSQNCQICAQASSLQRPEMSNWFCE